MYLKKDDDLSQYGIIPFGSTKRIPLGNTNEDYEIYRIPLSLLKYNSNNGRIFLEINRLKAENGIELNTLENSDPEEFNNEIENLIWETSEEKNEITMRDIERFTQLEPGVILPTGVVIDGNRRFTCLRRLHSKYPNDERFAYFNAAILFLDEMIITEKDIKSFELRVQFGRDQQVDYNPVNFAMSIYQEIKTGNFSIQEIADNVNKKPSEITKITQTCKLIEEFLEYIHQENQLYIAEELKIYWPLEYLGMYINGASARRLSSIDKIKRKHLYFDYILSMDVRLPTQEFRDNLIKKIYNDNNQFSELLNKYNAQSAGVVQTSILDNDDTPEEFVQRVKNFRKSDDANNILIEYKSRIERINMEQLAYSPVQISEDALERLKQINIEPLIRANSNIADDNLRKLFCNLKESKSIIDEIETQISSKLELNV